MSKSLPKEQCDVCGTPMVQYMVPGTGGREVAWRLNCDHAALSMMSTPVTSKEDIARIRRDWEGNNTYAACGQQDVGILLKRIEQLETRVKLLSEWKDAVVENLTRAQDRYHLLREHTAPKELHERLLRAGRKPGEWRDLPLEQSIVEKIDEICDSVINRGKDEN